MLTDKEIQHIAKLARIDLTKQEKTKFKKELSSILDYIKQLNKLDTEGIEPLYQAGGIVNALRKDEPEKRRTTSNILQNRQFWNETG